MKFFKYSIAIFIISLLPILSFAASVEQKNGRVYILDRTGYRWDVTQAQTLGFNPEKFQYGIGMNAFTTLDDSHLKESSSTIRDRSRVIGIEHKNQTHAYSVSKLRYHEIANTTIGDLPITTGY